MKKTALLASSLATLAVAAPASAGTYICVPSTAGAAVTSGGASGTCASGSTTVQLPSSAADQQTLISMLPYLSFSPSDVGQKPTIRIKGVNVRMSTASANDGTANLIIGGAGPTDYQSASYMSGSSNLIVGDYHRVTGSKNIVGGDGNIVNGYDGLVAGEYNTVANVMGAVAFGQNNHVSGAFASMLGGRQNTVSGYWATLDGGSGRTLGMTDGGAEDVSFVNFNADGTLRNASNPNIKIYRTGTGLEWIYWPGAHLKSCAITATTAGTDYGSNATARRLYDQSYDEWALISIMNGSTFVDEPVNATIACPTVS